MGSKTSEQRDSMTDTHAEKLGFEPFGTLDGVLAGKPIKIMPVGKFYRDERVLDITESDLREIERNVAAGLPRFRIPINENHQPGGKIGTVKSVKYMPDGPDGKGLYADAYELTDVGKQLLKDGRYDALSPELIWTKNGATYQDPQTGKRLDNVLVGVAICEKPFFSHDHVALFSATEPSMDKPKRGNGYTKLREMMKAKFDELMAMVKDDDGDGEPDEMPDMPPKKKMPEMATATFSTSATFGTSVAKADWTPMNTATTPVADAADKPAAHAATQGVDTMADTNIQPTPPATEQMTQVITAEQFAAVQAELAAQRQAAETFRVELAKTSRARRLDQLTARVEQFMAISAEKSELAGKLLDLEEKAPELFGYFDGLLAQLDGALVQSDLFTARADGRDRQPERGADTFDAAVARELKDHFDGDQSKYAEAALAVARRDPALARAR